MQVEMSEYLECERRMFRAEAEVAKLRELLRRAERALSGVPSPSVSDLNLMEELKRG